MAKQTSLIKINGKADGQSFYTSKNGGALMRSINKGMSARVKTDKVYANTRKNNAEFGMCGDFAGAIVKPISLRWRFILSSIATGILVKKMKELIKLDNAGAWGQRVITPANFDVIMEAFNSLSKNEMISPIVNTLSAGVEYSEDSHQVHVDPIPVISAELASELLAEGVNHFEVKVFNLTVNRPNFDAQSQAYSKAIASLTEITDMGTGADITAAGNINLFDVATAGADFDNVLDTSAFGGLLVVFLPCRKVGTSISVLQEKCSAYLAPVVAEE